MDYTSFETDDCMTTLLVNNAKAKSLQLYAIKWMFDTSKLDKAKLRKLDDEKI